MKFFGRRDDGDGGRAWPTYLFGRVRSSTIILIVALLGTWWLYDAYSPTANPPAAPDTQVVPPGYVPDPEYTWVPRTKVRIPTTTPTTTETTPTTTEPTETTSPTEEPTEPGQPTTGTESPGPNTLTTTAPVPGGPAPTGPTPTGPTPTTPMTTAPPGPGLLPGLVPAPG